MFLSSILYERFLTTAVVTILEYIALSSFFFDRTLCDNTQSDISD